MLLLLLECYVILCENYMYGGIAQLNTNNLMFSLIDSFLGLESTYPLGSLSTNKNFLHSQKASLPSTCSAG